MSKTYRLAVSEQNDGVSLADADGSIDIVSYVARKLSLDNEQIYSVELSETDAIAGDPTRIVLSLTADGETVSLLLASRLRKERLAEKESAEVPASTDESLTEVPEPATV